MVRTVFLRTAPAQSPAQSYKLEDCLLTISINGEDCLLTISINGEDCLLTISINGEDCLLTISINGEDCLLTISINGEDCFFENCSSTVPSTVLQIGGLFANHFHKRLANARGA